MILLQLSSNFTIVEGMFGSVNDYIIRFYINSDLMLVNNTACGKNECVYMSLITCPQSDEISVTISAANTLGEGPSTDPIVIGMIVTSLILD